MAQITDILSTLDELLKPGEFDDLGPNGLQVPGSREVTRVVTGVSARRELHERAVELGAELVLVHHGLFWKFHPAGLTPLLASACGRSSSTTSTSSAITCRWTRIRRWATTRC